MRWTLFIAGSITGDGSAIFSPFGSKQNYTDMQQVSFDTECPLVLSRRNAAVRMGSFSLLPT